MDGGGEVEDLSMKTTMSEIARPLLRYHGGKYLLAPWIIQNFPEHRVYVEPYGGAASVLLQKDRSYAEVYNDLCGEVVNLFRVVRESGRELVRALELTPFSRDDFNLSYEPSADSLEQARRTVARSFMGFGSNAHNRKTGFRSNSNRSGTTPARDWRNYPRALPAIIERLQGVVIENRDAVDVMLAHDSPRTLHYVDPPYVFDTRGKGEDYKYEMTDVQHRELGEVLNQLQGYVVVSGYPSPLYDEIFEGWKKVERRALADGAQERTEALWMRNVPHDLFTPR